ncbi:MAG: nitroreductase family protein [Paraprevotella sp.]|nr:nitroreductase family protein [Paraprevotella sp.]
MEDKKICLEEALKSRRSYYALASDIEVSDERIEELVKMAARWVPSAFNSQSARMVLLLGDAHLRLWQIVKDTLKAMIPAAAFVRTEQKIDRSFAAGHGTVLFFEDGNLIADLQRKFPTYADNFPAFSQHTSAMHQLAIWMLLENEGLGASLQHYNPVIDEAVRQAFHLPESWSLVAQMPFGRPLDIPGEKTFCPIEEKVFVIR